MYKEEPKGKKKKKERKNTNFDFQGFHNLVLFQHILSCPLLGWSQ